MNYVNINNPKAREKVLNMIIEANMVDVWRELNLEKQQFTWRRKATNQHSRSDYFLISGPYLQVLRWQTFYPDIKLTIHYYS